MNTYLVILCFFVNAIYIQLNICYFLTNKSGLSSLHNFDSNSNERFVAQKNYTKHIGDYVFNVKRKTLGACKCNSGPQQYNHKRQRAK